MIYKYTIVVFVLLLDVSNLLSQELKILDHSLYEKSIGLCEALEEYGLAENFEIKRIAENLISLDVKLEDVYFHRRSFVLIVDSLIHKNYLLNQIWLSTDRLKITEENFRKLKIKAEELINTYTLKLGSPTKSEINEEYFWGEKSKKGFDNIIMSVWDVKGTKTQIALIMTNENDTYEYELFIHKYIDYIGNSKLPEWWDGY